MVRSIKAMTKSSMRRALVKWDVTASAQGGAGPGARGGALADAQRPSPRDNQWIDGARRAREVRRIRFALRGGRAARCAARGSAGSSCWTTRGAGGAVRSMCSRGCCRPSEVQQEASDEAERGRLFTRTASIFDAKKRAQRQALNAWYAEYATQRDLRRYMAAVVNGQWRALFEWERGAREIAQRKHTMQMVARTLVGMGGEHRLGTLRRALTG